jgi:hypothetical protein
MGVIPEGRTMPKIVCPICERELRKNEALQVSHDAIGSLIVHHMVPDTVPDRMGGMSDAQFDALIEAEPWMGPDHVRSICGRAGFKHFVVSE